MGEAQAFLTPKRDQIKKIGICSRATLNETFTAKFEIYTPTRDDGHPRPFHMRVPPPPQGGGNMMFTNFIHHKRKY